MADRLSDPIGRLMGLRYKSHPWHGVFIGKDAPENVVAFIEVVPTDTVKYEIDKESGFLKLDRPQKYSNVVPALYGFIPQTLDEDGDELDVLLITDSPLATGVVVEAKILGYMKFVDDGEVDDKIIGVPADDRNTGNAYNTLEDLPKQLLKQIEFHFSRYKDLKKPGSTVVEKFADIDEAKRVVAEAIERWNNQ